MNVLEARTIRFAVVVSCIFLLSTNIGYSQSNVDPQPELRVVEAGPFRVHLHVANEEVAEQVKRVARQTWGVASGLYRTEMPTKKLDVHLYRNIDGYVAAEEKLTGGKFKRNLAFAHFDTLSAHVTLQPPISDSLLKEVGLPKQSARLLAHEMAHLVRYKRMPNSFRDHPRWLIDGVATHIEERVLAAIGYIDSPMHDPNFGADASRGKRLLREGKLPTVEQLLDNTKIDLGFYEEYSVRWLFVDMMVTKYEKQFRSFVQDLPLVAGGRGYAKRTKKLLLKHLAIKANTLNQNFRDHVEQLKPDWVEYGRSLETQGPVWHHVAFPDSTATAWNQSALGDSFAISTTATIHEPGRKQLNIRVGQEDSFTQFSVTAGFGLNVFVFADKKWETKLGKKIAGIETGKPFKLKLSVAGDENEALLTLDGAQIFQGPIDLNAESQFALGAQKGSAVSWEAFEVE